MSMQAYCLWSVQISSSPLIFPRKKEKALVDLEAECNLADRKLHELEASSSSLKTQLKAKHEELRGMRLLRQTISC